MKKSKAGDTGSRWCRRWRQLFWISGCVLLAGCGSPSFGFTAEELSEGVETGSSQTKGILVIDADTASEDGSFWASETVERSETAGFSGREPESVTGAVETELEETVSETSDAGGEEVSSPIVPDLTQEQIQRINESTYANPAAGCYDVLSVQDMTGEEASAWIRSVSFPESSWCNGQPLTAEQKAAIEENRNLEAIPERVVVQYGILTDNADVRLFPTASVLQTENSPEAFDLMQESVFGIGEMAAVLHTSADGAYVYVIGSNDKGWIRREQIGLTEHTVLEQWKQAMTHPAVVIEPYVKVGDLPPFRMGTMFPLLAHTADGMCVSYPVNQEGRLELTEQWLPAGNDIADGFLPYTYEAAAGRMAQMEGVAYGWGDTHLNYDCSSAVGAVYRCFGIFLPRNTANMAAAGTAVISLEQMGIEARDGLIRNLPAGTLLLMKGHVMMYMGLVQGEPKIAHMVSRYSEDGTVVKDCYQWVETSLYIWTGSLRSYEEALTHAICF